MHDLNQIAKMNENAHADAIMAERGAGKWVLVTYTGLHLARHEAFSDEPSGRSAEAQARARRTPDERIALLEPIPAAQVIGKRDQSEDRVSAAHNHDTMEDAIEHMFAGHAPA